jgi:hypothetical protein
MEKEKNSMATLGRKSIISHEQRIIDHKVNNQYVSEENYRSIVLDIVGGHNPTSRFYTEENFDFGVFFIVASYDLEQIFPVKWSESYEMLRTLLGTDENICGRRCLITAKSSRKSDLRNASISFLESKRNVYQNEQSNNYSSIGGLYGVVGNYEAMFKSYETDLIDGSGETWLRIM